MSSLILAAETDRWRRIKKTRHRLHPKTEWNPDVFRLLTEMGLFNLINAKGAPKAAKPKIGDTRFIKFRSGNMPCGEQIELLQKKMHATIGEAIFFEQEKGSKFYNSLSEAMVNVSHHAYDDYPKDACPCLDKQWWMTGSYKGKTGKVTFTFFDQGVGIPKTLPKKHSEWVAQFISRINGRGTDAEMIAAAMEIGRTQTKASNRGYGLNDIKRFTEIANEAKLTIFSNRGKFVYSNSAPDELEELETSIGGTLIHWEATLL